jgi:phospholipid-translocating ATPase
VIDSEPPHANLYSYNGVLQYSSKADGPGREHPVIEGRQLGQAKEHKDAITINELLLRGCAIRNTQWIIGIVAYTGEDTKIMLNQGATPSKRSKIEKETNFNVIANFVILVGMCAACGIANGFYLASNSTSSDSYELGSSPASNNILNAVVTFG